MSSHDWSGVIDSWLTGHARDTVNVAIEDEVVRWTHRELAEHVQDWRDRIGELPPEARNVAIHLPHQAETIAALIGVLSAGRCAVPLDPAQPINYRTRLLHYADVDFLIGRPEDGPSLAAAGWPGTVVLRPTRNQNCASLITIDPDATAFLYFTSGSSGQPKGVVWRHRTVQCAAVNLQAMFQFTAKDRHALVSPIAVAASAAQILAVLSAGATLCLCEARWRSHARIVDWLRACRITTLQTVPSLFRALAREAGASGLGPTIRALKLGGETATSADARLFARCAADGACLINGLGLTEAGFNVCWWTLRAGEELKGEFLPIGRPPATLELELERSPGVPAAKGEVGEIVVRSRDFPDGYWKDADRSARVYRALAERPGWSELRTGDFGRWRSDGQLEYRGRLDSALKIRGHRVFPAEVEAVLAESEDVAAAAVVAGGEGVVTRLEAFVQLHPNARRNGSDLQRAIAARLPAEMVPAHVHVIDSMPYLPSGKIHRSALSKAMRHRINAGAVAGYPLALQLAVIWKEALGLKEVGTTDDFFALGGDSLAAASIVSGIEKLLGVTVPVGSLLHAPTIEKLAIVIKEHNWHENDFRLVSLRLGRDKTPLYCVPSAGSRSFEFRVLAEHFDEDQPVFSFQPPGVDDDSAYLHSVEDLAQCYIDAIRRHQPEGPYYLCGNSFGGVVAFEMAKRLTAENEEVPLLVLLDSYADEYPQPRANLPLRKRFRLAVAQLLPLGQWPWSTWRGFKAGVIQWVQRRLIQLDMALPFHILDRPYSWRFLYFQEICLAARRRYSFSPFHGKIHLFRASIQMAPDIFEPDLYLGWRGMATGGIEIAELPCAHSDYLQEPYAPAMAKTLTLLLQQTARPDRCLSSSLRREDEKAKFAVAETRSL